jgi:hypothetical protein
MTKPTRLWTTVLFACAAILFAAPAVRAEEGGNSPSPASSISASSPDSVEARDTPQAAPGDEGAPADPGSGLTAPEPKEQCGSCTPTEGPWVDPLCREDRCPLHEARCSTYCAGTLGSEMVAFSCTDEGHSLYCECANGFTQSCDC